MRPAATIAIASERCVLSENGVPDVESVRAEIRRHRSWYHRIELAPGVLTPGSNQSAKSLARLDQLGLPRDCSGLRALDIGCRDGFFSFELERRGAKVVAIDTAKADETGFPIAARILDSHVGFVTADVMSLDPADYGLFDLVLFLGVLYHLPHPSLALERIRSVTRPEGRLFLETQIAVDDRVAGMATPAWQYFPAYDLRGDDTNRWVPNPPAVEALLGDTGFVDCEVSAGKERAYARATAPEDTDFVFGEYFEHAFHELDGQPPEPDVPYDPKAYAKSLRVVLEARDRELRGVRALLEVAQNNATDLERGLEELRAIHRAGEDLVDSLEGVLEARNSELDAMRPVLAARERELASAQRALEARAEELESLREVVATRDEELASVKAVLGAREVELTNLRALLTEREEELARIKRSFFGRLAAS